MRLLPTGTRETLTNRKNFFKSLNVSPDDVASMRQVHGATVLGIASSLIRAHNTTGDGFWTQEKNLFLSITMADCLPIFLYVPEQKIAGLLHAGWKGISAGIIEEAIFRAQEIYDSPSKNIYAGIGPGIDSCHFEIQEDLLAKFNDISPDCLRIIQGKIFLDLKKIAHRKLKAAGIPSDHIRVSPECTFCERAKYFSYRREKTIPPKVMVAVIGRKR